MNSTKNNILEKIDSLLTENEQNKYIPINKRIAYVVSHATSYASNGYAIRTHTVARELCSLGYEVYCLVKPGRPWDLKEEINLSTETEIDNVKYIHSDKNDKYVFSSYYDGLEKNVEYFLNLFKIYRPQIVIGASDYKISLPSLIASKLLGIPFINEVRGFWELTRLSRDEAYIDSFDYETQVELDSYVAQNSEYVITLNSIMKEYLVKRQVLQEKVIILPNGVNQLPFVTLSKDKLRKDSQSRKIFTIGFIGSINNYEGLEDLIEACSLINKNCHEVNLLIVGSNKAYKDDSGLADDEYYWLTKTGRVEHSKVCEFYSKVDLIVIPRRPERVCNIVPPLKVVESLSYNKNIIVSDVPPLKEYAEKYEGISMFESGNVLDLKNKIIEKIQKPHNTINRKSLLLSKHTKSLSDVINIYVNARKENNLTTLPELEFTREQTVYKVLLDFEGLTSEFISSLNIQDIILESSDTRLAIFIKSASDDFILDERGALVLGKDIKYSAIYSSCDLIISEKNLEEETLPYTTTFKQGLNLLKAILNIYRDSLKSKVLYFVHTNDSNLEAGYHKRTLHLNKGFINNGIKIPIVSLNSEVFGSRNNINFISKDEKFISRILEWIRPTTVIAASNHENASPILKIRQNQDFEFIYEMRGLWHETYAAKMLEKNSNYDIENDKFYKKSLNLELDVISESDKVVFICPEMKSYLEEKTSKVLYNTEIVGNGFSVNSVPQAVEKSDEHKKHFTIGYFGAITYYEGITFLLDTISALSKDGYNIKVILLGKNSIKEKWILDLDKYDFVSYHGFVDDVDSYYNKIDLFVIPRLPYAVCHSVEPLKPFDCFARKIPLLISDCSSLNRIAGEGKRAFVFQAGNAKSLKNSISSIYDKGYPKDKIENAFNWLINNASWNDITKNYYKFFKSRRKKIYFLYADKWCLSYKWSGASINALNEMAILCENNDVYYNDIYVNDLFHLGIFNEQKFINRYNEVSQTNTIRSNIFSKILLPSRHYDISFYRSGEGTDFVRFFDEELPHPKVFSHNYVKSIWENNIVGFQTESSYHYARHKKLKEFDDDGTLGYSNCNILPRASFIRYQANVQKFNRLVEGNTRKENSGFVIGVIGTIYDGTDPIHLINAVRKLRDKYKNKEFKLVFYTINVLIDIPKEEWITVSTFSKDQKSEALSKLDLIVNTWNSSAQLYSGSNKNIDAIEYEVPLIAARTPAYEEQLGKFYPLYYTFNEYFKKDTGLIESQFTSLIEKCFESDFIQYVKSYMAWRKKFIAKENASFLYDRQMDLMCEKKIAVIGQNLSVGGVQKYTRQLVDSFRHCEISLFLDTKIERSLWDQFDCKKNIIKIFNLQELFDYELSQYECVFINSFPVDSIQLEKVIATAHSQSCKIYPILHSDIHPFTVEITKHLSKIDRIIAINDKIVDKINYSCGIDFRNKFYHITPSLDFTEFEFKQPKKIRQNRIAFFGRIARLKCVDFLCEAFYEYVISSNSDYELWICGPVAYSGLERLIDDLNKKIGREAILLFNKEFDSADKEELFSKIDALVYTTATEGLPYTFLEANANGVPIISSNVGAISTLIKDSVNGYLLDFPDLYLPNLFEEKPYNKLASIMSSNKTENIEIFKNVLFNFEFGSSDLEELSFNSIFLANSNFGFDKMRKLFLDVVYSYE